MGDWDSFELFVIEQKQRIGNWVNYKQMCIFAPLTLRMMTMMKNELGNKYNRLTVIGQEQSTAAGVARWMCECECGNRLVVRAPRLRSGETNQCRVCAALARGKREREQGFKREWLYSKQSKIEAFYKRLEREDEHYSLNNYYFSL